jgi:HPt (histidine-containing phosphotransfer) domain-containing protein
MDDPDEEAAPAIDVEVLEELERSIGDDPVFMRDLVERYLEDAPSQLATIRAGVESGEAEPVNRAAHTLKSGSASVGAMALSDLARDLQAMTAPATTEAADLADPQIGRIVAAISTELSRVAAELEALVPPTDL